MKRWMVLPLMLLSVAASAQAPNWVFRLGSQTNAGMNAIVVDAVGNSYVTGEFSGVVDLGGPLLISNGGLDIVVVKFGPDGDLLWSHSFGGPGLDRGIALDLGPSGDLVVTGQFTGNVTFGGEVLQSQGGTQDIFVMRMQTNDGSVLWTRQGGSADGVDQPSGVSVGPDGSVVVTGEFRGTAVFDGVTLTSMEDPDTEEPSVDIFIAAYASDGSPQWLKHGAAKKADRGVAVTHDPAGNVYVTGQFSDTLTLDQTVPNAMFNAVFLTCFDPAGTQQWLRVFGGGVYNHVHGLQVVDGNRLMLMGDVRGTVIFLDSQPDIFTASAPRSSFLMEVGFDGEFIRQTTWGSEHTFQTRAFSVQGNEVLVFGRFQCQLTDFSAIYGDGVFIAMGVFDMYVARFDLADLSFKDAQQFGGQFQKQPNGIAHLPGGEPVFCGAFQGYLLFPIQWYEDFRELPPGDYGLNVEYVPGPDDGFCGDPDYGSIGYLWSGGPWMNGFITKGWVEGREPFDFFRRLEGPCERDIPPMAITWNGIGVPGPDSVQVCGSGELGVDTRCAIGQGYSAPVVGPLVTVQWSNGSETLPILVTETGWYAATVTVHDGCVQWVDSLHVTVHPFGDLDIAVDMDVVLNYSYEEDFYSVLSCEPFWMWGEDMTPGYTLEIIPPDGSASVQQGDSIFVVDGGEYVMYFVGPDSCVNEYFIGVSLAPSLDPIPPLEVSALLSAIVDDQTYFSGDTVHICEGNALGTSFEIDYYQDGDPIELPVGLYVNYSVQGGSWGPTPEYSQPNAPEGWLVTTLTVLVHNGPCGDDSLFFSFVDSIYVLHIAPGIFPTYMYSGPSHICEGDTVTIAVTCNNCPDFSWSGPHIVADHGDSISVSGPGWYQISPEGLPPCTYWSPTSHVIQWNMGPVLQLVPLDGVLCPDSTAQIFTTMPGSDFQWYGPLGALDEDANSIVTTHAGYYYLEMVDTLGCQVTSDPVFLSPYGTPYLIATPSNALCEPGDEATLEVVTTSPGTLEWLPPLSGNSTWQTVDQPGVYSCQVTSCGIVTLVSVEIFGNTAVTELTTEGPYQLCEGAELQLEVQPGNLVTYWMPGFLPGPLLNVTSGGTYTLIAVDVNGCEEEVEVVVEQFGYELPLSVPDTVVCAGTTVMLVAAGSGQIAWYADAALQDLLGTGNMLDLGTVTTSQTIYVQQTEEPCTSDAQAVQVVALPQPGIPVISGPVSVCTGQDVTLFVTDPDADQFFWTTPQGDMTGAQLLLQDIDTTAAGPYQVVASSGPCTQLGPEHVLQVYVAQELTLGPDTSFCVGDVFVLQVPPGFTAAEWSTGSTEPTITVTAAGTYGLSAEDPNGCPVDASVVLEGIDCGTEIPNVFSPNGDGVNDVIHFAASGEGKHSFWVYNRWGQQVALLEGETVTWDGRNTFTGMPLPDGTYFYVLHLAKGNGSEEAQRGTITLLR